MKNDNQLFDDFARVAMGGIGVLQGMKGEVSEVTRQLVEKIVADCRLVPRDEFDVVKQMLKDLIVEKQELIQRINVLESKQEIIPEITNKD